MEMFAVAIILALIIFIITREFWCWYFKFTKIHNKLSEISSKFDTAIRRLIIRNIPSQEEATGSIPDTSFKIGSKKKDIFNYYGKPDKIIKKYLPDGVYEEVLFSSLRLTLYFKNETLTYWEMEE